MNFKRIISFILFIAMFFGINNYAQTVQSYIRIDQFGYRPGDKKTAVIVDPQVGYNAADEFVPGSIYQVRKKSDNTVVFQGTPVQWNNGKTCTQSGDRGWWFNFSEVNDPGEYYIYDVDKDVRSYYFQIDAEVYKNMLKAATKMFYFQRLGIEKEAKYAGKWSDGYQLPMDSVCRDINDKNNPAKFKDMRGGWMDAGDQNKYVTFTIEPVNTLLSAYEQNPEVFTDDFDIPESGNGIPDIIDEIKWEIDWLKRMQDTTDGGAYIKMGGEVSVPFSQDKNPKYYFSTKSTAAAIDISCMLAHAYLVFKQFPQLEDYANDCKRRAIKGWEYFNSHPINITIDDGSLGGGRANRDEATQKADALTAAIYLFAATGESKYNDYIIKNYANPGTWGIYNNYRSQAFLYYAFLPNANSDLAIRILNDKVNSYTSNAGGFTKWDETKELYGAYMADAQYHWGSNQPKANAGNTLTHFLNYYLQPQNYNEIKNHALNFLHYFHGVNPVNLTYLTNMEHIGGDNCTKYAWHKWFNPDQCPTGYIPGGPNRSYAPDASFGGVLSPPQNQPAQKSYKDWVKSWPDKAWEVTEPAIYYQAAYVYLVSNFAKANETFTADLDSLQIFHQPEDSLFQGEEKSFYVRMYPLKAFNTKLIWESADTSIALIDSTGKLSAIKAGTVKIKATAGNGVADSVLVSIKECSAKPFNGYPLQIPGLIEAEEFDLGCNTYFDYDNSNEGKAFRTGEGVDIEFHKDDRGLYDVGWIHEGEWLKYTVDVKNTDTYIVECRVAAIKECLLMIDFSDGTKFKEPVKLLNSGGYQNWYSFYTDTLRLTEGVKSMKVSFLSDGYNINHLKFHKFVPVTGVEIAHDTVFVIKGNEKTVSAEVLGDEGIINEVSWESSDTDIASVDKNGVIKALKVGSTYIKAISKVGNFSDSVLVIVEPVSSAHNNTYLTDINVYPNPVNQGFLTIEVPNGITKEMAVNITDVTGKVVYQKTIPRLANNKIYINCELPNGMYIVNVSGEQYISSKLVVFFNSKL